MQKGPSAGVMEQTQFLLRGLWNKRVGVSEQFSKTNLINFFLKLIIKIVKFDSSSNADNLCFKI